MANETRTLTRQNISIFRASCVREMACEIEYTIMAACVTVCVRLREGRRTRIRLLCLCFACYFFLLIIFHKFSVKCPLSLFPFRLFRLL